MSPQRGTGPSLILYYLRQRWPILLVLLVCTGILALVLALHQVPAEPAI